MYVVCVWYGGVCGFRFWIFVLSNWGVSFWFWEEICWFFVDVWVCYKCWVKVFWNVEECDVSVLFRGGVCDYCFGYGVCGFWLVVCFGFVFDVI